MGVLGVLLAGGQGRRLGLDVPKALVSVGGKTLFDRALETLRRVTDEVVVAAPQSIDLPAPPPGVRRVFDRAPGDGPLAGIDAALQSTGDEFEMVVVLGVDFPFMKPECLGWMVSQLRNAPAWNAVIPAPAGRSQPLTAVYNPNTIATFLDRDRALKGSIIEAMRGHSVKMLSDEELEKLPGGVLCFFNLNTPEDLAEAERRFAAMRVKA